jgi:hypothetical protein
MKATATIESVEKELEKLKDELNLCREAKPVSDTCSELKEYSEREEEPFSSSHTDPIPWHKSQNGGGGCAIL